MCAINIKSCIFADVIARQINFTPCYKCLPLFKTSYMQHITMKYLFTTIFALLLFSLAMSTQAQSSGCIGTASISVTIEECIGIEEIWDSANIELYPNPFRDALSIVLPQNLLTASCQVSIADLSGKIFYSQAAKQGTVQIPTDNLPKGMYVVSVKAANEKYQHKIIKY